MNIAYYCYFFGGTGRGKENARRTDRIRQSDRERLPERRKEKARIEAEGGRDGEKVHSVTQHTELSY